MSRKLSTPFANDSTQRNIIPVTATQSQTDLGLASYSGGFGSKNMIPIENGGQPPYGQDFNGVLYDITGNIVDINQGILQYFDADYSALIGGYPINSRLMLDNNKYYVKSTISNNQNNPNSNLKGWEIEKSDYAFKTAQPLQYYYDQIGNWDDAIFQAQLNIYLKGYSSVLLLPASEITITRPILGCVALGNYMVQYFKDNNITNDFYDAVNQRFNYNWNFNLQGAGRTQSYIKYLRPTAIDKTYSDWGAIHVGISAEDIKKFKAGGVTVESILKGWFKSEMIVNGFTIYGAVSALGDGVPDRFNNYKPNSHGIVQAYIGSHHHNVQQITVDLFWGGGMVLDHDFDSLYDDVFIFRCGKMVGDYPTWAAMNSKTDAKYQLYAPLQVTKYSGAGDNSNFLRFNNFHFEDNYDCVVDALFTSASPIWINDWHIECEKEDGNDVQIAYYEGKCAVWGSGGVCTNYLGQENETGFDIENFAKADAAGGTTFIKSSGVVMYPQTYSHGYIGTIYSKHQSSKSDWGFISLQGSDDEATFSLIQGSIGGLEASSIKSDLAVKLDDVVVNGDIEFNYNAQYSFKDVRGSGKFSVQNTSAYVLPNRIDNCIFDYVTGHLYNTHGTISTKSTTQANSVLFTGGNVKILSDAYRRANYGY